MCSCRNKLTKDDINNLNRELIEAINSVKRLEELSKEYPHNKPSYDKTIKTIKVRINYIKNKLKL